MLDTEPGSSAAPQESSPSLSALPQLGLPEVPLQLSPWAKALRSSEAFKHGEQVCCIVRFPSELLYIDTLLTTFTFLSL